MNALTGTKVAAIVALLSTIATATCYAADLPAAPMPGHVVYAAPAQYNWSGFYLGINGGYGIGNSSWESTGVATGNFKTNGPLAGGTLGINYQAGSFVFGFEADADWAGFKGSNSSNPYCAGTACETKEDWLITARARVGYAFNRLLIYGTAGGAAGEIRAGFNPPGIFDTSNSFGWTAGGGLEAGITENWTVKVEYLYVDLGNGSCSSLNCGGLPITVPLTENLVRAGINYRFSW